jgi:hypothetical protein
MVKYYDDTMRTGNKDQASKISAKESEGSEFSEVNGTLFTMK